MQIALDGKTCLVTGGSRGIGRSIAIALAKSGANVAFDYHQRKDAAEQVKQEIEQSGGRAQAYQADVGDLKAVQSLVESIRNDFGPVQILVNNAGINRDHSFAKMTREEWDEVLRVNLSGAFNTCSVIAPGMVEGKWGRIINISSVVGQMGSFGQTNYAASKAGLIGMTKSLAIELTRKGVTANVVAPGYIRTEMTAGMPAEVVAKVEERIPAQRFGEPEEIAPAVVFLASEEARYITGQVIAINGGIYM